MAPFSNRMIASWRMIASAVAKVVNRGSLVVLLPWFAVALFEQYAKFSILSRSGFRQCAFSLGKSSGTLTIWEKLYLFPSDLLIGVVLIPCLLCLLFEVAPQRFRAHIAAAFAFVIAAALFLQVQVLQFSGGYVSATIMWKAILLATASRDSLIRLVIPSGGLTFALRLGLILLVVGIAWWTAINLKGRPRAWLNRVLVVYILASLGSGIAIAAVTPQDFLPWGADLFTTAFSAYADLAPADPGALVLKVSELDPIQLTQLQRRLSNTPPVESSNAYSGKAQGYNVLFFVLETTPTQILDPARDALLDMPNLRRLREHAFVASRHFATVPQTNRVIYSLFSSMFSRFDVGQMTPEAGVEVPSFIREMKDAGYETGFYGYVWTDCGEHDDRLLSGLGFKQIVAPGRGTVGEDVFWGPVQNAERVDLDALHSLETDIDRWSRAGQRFTAAFFPELGHDPWRDVNGNKIQDFYARGHALAVYQDAWLGRLIQRLESNGILDRTIIVVTADHGLRHFGREEIIPLEKPEDTNFHVPLLIYVPQVLNGTERIDLPTSHIDVVPTLKELLGMEHSSWEQGAVLWDAALKARTVFFSSLDDGKSANGFIKGDVFTFCNRAGVSFQSRTFSFSDSNIIAFNSSAAIDARAKLRQQSLIDEALLRRILSGPTWTGTSPRGH